MLRLRYLIASLGVSLLGVLSISSQASADWMVNGTTLTGTAALATTAAVDEEVQFSAAGVLVKCSGNNQRFVNPVMNGVTGMADALSWESTGCVATQPCRIAESMKETISTLPILIDAVLEGALAVKGRVLPVNSSKVFMTVKFEGAECSLAGVQTVKGSQAVLIPTGQDERTAQTITTVSEGEGLKVGTSAVTMKGSVLGRTAGGLPFSFL